jgi:hypothetical protein
VGAGAVRIRGDGNKLLRWAIKVTFNSQRAAGGHHVNTLRSFVPFILGDVAEGPIPVELNLALVRPVRATSEEQAAGAGEMIEVSDDKVGEQTCFGDDVAFAPALSVGPVILQLLVFAPGTGRAARRRALGPWRKGMRFERVPSRAFDLRVEPSRMDARTWLTEITMATPDAVVEGEVQRLR